MLRNDPEPGIIAFLYPSFLSFFLFFFSSPPLGFVMFLVYEMRVNTHAHTHTHTHTYTHTHTHTHTHTGGVVFAPSCYTTRDLKHADNQTPWHSSCSRLQCDTHGHIFMIGYVHTAPERSRPGEGGPRRRRGGESKSREGL